MKSGRACSSLLLCLLALSVSAAGCTLNIGLKKEPVPLDAAKVRAERTPVYRHQGWIIARASLHNHTTFSDGRRTAGDLLEMARLQGMAILAYTDHREGKLCVGKSKLLCVQTGGVESYGYDTYHRRLADIQAEARDMDVIVLRGVEVSPPYIYNYGRFPWLVLGGGYNHFTVYAVEDPSILKNMPARRGVPLKPEPVPGADPLQGFVDYIADHHGIVHAVHVESDQDEWFATVHMVTPPPVYNLHLRRLTGFAVLPSAWHEKAGGPGGLWDTALIEYLAGMREKPLWASADADYHGPGGSLANATTLFYMKEFTEEEVYKCMRQGRMVALQGDAFQDVYVAEWWVGDGEEPENPVMLGKEVSLRGTPEIRFALSRQVPRTRALLIRNGMVIHEQEGSQLSFRDKELGRSREPAFYRVEVRGPRAQRGAWKGPTMPQSELFTNPLFVRFHSAH